MNNKSKTYSNNALREAIRKEILHMVSEATRKFEVDDKVKVTNMSLNYSGKTGTVIDISPSDSFFLVKFGSNQNAYFHESDIKLVKRPSIG